MEEMAARMLREQWKPVAVKEMLFGLSMEQQQRNYDRVCAMSDSELLEAWSAGQERSKQESYLHLLQLLRDEGRMSLRAAVRTVEALDEGGWLRGDD